MASRTPVPAFNRGFTLIELLVALVVLTFIAVAGYSSLNTVVQTRDRVAQETRKWQHLTYFFSRLEQDVAVPFQPQPAHILDDAVHIFRAAARRVDILDPQQETAIACRRHIVRCDCRPGMASVQSARRAGREPRYDHISCGRCARHA